MRSCNPILNWKQRNRGPRRNRKHTTFEAIYLLFKHYRDAILRELQFLPGFIIGFHTLKSIRICRWKNVDSRHRNEQKLLEEVMSIWHIYKVAIRRYGHEKFQVVKLPDEKLPLGKIAIEKIASKKNWQRFESIYLRVL